MKKFWIVVAALVAGLLLLVIAAALLIDADRFRPEVQRRLGAALGRDVEIGALKLSLLAGGLAATGIRVSEDPTFGNAPFLEAESVEIGAALLPLITSRPLQVQSVTIRKPQVRLVRAPGGRWNFSSLGGQASSRTGSAAPAPGFAIGKLRIVEGRITVAESAGRAAARVYDEVELTAENVSAAAAMPFALSATTPGGGKLKMQGTAGPLNASDAARTPFEAMLNLAHLDLSATGFLDPSSGLAGILDYDGKLHSDGATMQMEGSARGEKLRFVKGGAPARQPLAFDYAASYDLKREAGALARGSLRSGLSAARLTGTYESRGTRTVLHARLNAENWPVGAIEGLLPAFGVTLPAGASLQGGTVNAQLNIEGPLDALVTSGPVNIANARLTGFDLGSKLRVLSALAGVPSTPDTMIQVMSSQLRVAPDGIRADNLNLVIANLGSITGSGTVGANKNLDFHMVGKFAGGGGVVGQLGQLGGLAGFGGQSKNGIPFMIQGTTSSPVFLPDVGGMVKGMAPGGAQPVQDLGGMLGGLFGKKKK